MNENQIKSQIGNSIPTTENHPLHILDNQVDPETKKVAETGQKAIHTYETDVAEALSRQQASIVTIAIAESEKKSGEQRISNKPVAETSKKVLLFTLGIIFIVAGVIGAYYLYLQSPLAIVDVRPITKINSIVPADTQKLVAVPSLKKEAFISFLSNQFKNTPLNPSKLSEIILTENSGSTTKRFVGSEFLDTTSFNITDSLKRSLTDTWMIGTYSNTDTVEPFIIMKTDFFQNAFAGMLAWEPNMPEDLADIFNYREKARNVNATASSTATTSISISSFYTIQGNFKDRIILNRDTREFISKSGDILFLYTFIDKDTLVITTSEDVISALLERIDKQTYVR